MGRTNFDIKILMDFIQKYNHRISGVCMFHPHALQISKSFHPIYIEANETYTGIIIFVRKIYNRIITHIKQPHRIPQRCWPPESRFAEKGGWYFYL